VNDTEQKPDDQGKSSDETAHDDIECEDADCCGYSKTERDEPETHPSDSERQANTEPHQEEVAYSVSHVDRFEECCETERKSEWQRDLLQEDFESSHDTSFCRKSALTHPPAGELL